MMVALFLVMSSIDFFTHIRYSPDIVQLLISDTSVKRYQYIQSRN